MDISFEKVNDRVIHAYQGEDRVGVITTAPNGQTGFRVFGEQLGGQVDTVDDAKEAMERHFEA